MIGGLWLQRPILKQDDPSVTVLHESLPWVGKFSGPTFIASLSRLLSLYPQYQTAQIKPKLFRSLVKSNPSDG
jgi:hypothetical protein